MAQRLGIIPLELARNADSLALPQTHSVRICRSPGSPGDSCAREPVCSKLLPGSFVTACLPGASVCLRPSQSSGRNTGSLGDFLPPGSFLLMVSCLSLCWDIRLSSISFKPVFVIKPEFQTQSSLTIFHQKILKRIALNRSLLSEEGGRNSVNGVMDRDSGFWGAQQAALRVGVPGGWMPHMRGDSKAALTLWGVPSLVGNGFG